MVVIVIFFVGQWDCWYVKFVVGLQVVKVVGESVEFVQFFQLWDGQVVCLCYCFFFFQGIRYGLDFGEGGILVGREWVLFDLGCDVCLGCYGWCEC